LQKVRRTIEAGEEVTQPSALSLQPSSALSLQPSDIARRCKKLDEQLKQEKK